MPGAALRGIASQQRSPRVPRPGVRGGQNRKRQRPRPRTATLSIRSVPVTTSQAVGRTRTAQQPQAPCRPPRLPRHVLPESGEAVWFPGLLLVKPGQTCGKVVEGFGGYAQACRAEVIAQPINPFFNPSNTRLVEMFVQLHSGENLIDHLDRSPQLPAGRGQHQDVIHERGGPADPQQQQIVNRRRIRLHIGLEDIPEARQRGQSLPPGRFRSAGAFDRAASGGVGPPRRRGAGSVCAADTARQRLAQAERQPQGRGW